MKHSDSNPTNINNKASLIDNIPVELLVHELRTPLNAMIGFTQIALEMAESKQDVAIATELKTSLRASRHLFRLVTDLLSLSKLDSGSIHLDIQSVALKDIFLGVSDALGSSISANGNQLIFNGADHTVHLMTDCMRLMQVLINLVSNANNHTQNGVITVTFEPSEINGTINDFITVSDTGCGIREKDIQTIFEPFAQDENAGIRTQPGTGLGLTISRTLCRLLKGDIFVHSTYGKGSTFTVVLPNNRFSE